MKSFVSSDLKKYVIVGALIIAAITYLYIEFFINRPTETAKYKTSLEETKYKSPQREHETPGTYEDIRSTAYQIPILVFIDTDEKYSLDKVSYTVAPYIETEGSMLRQDTTLRVAPKGEIDWERGVLYKITVNSSKDIFNYYFKITEPEDMRMGF